MRVAFHWPPTGKRPDLMPALADGMRAFGDTIHDVRSFEVAHDHDAGVFYSISGAGRWAYPKYVESKKPFVFIDKGYSRPAFNLFRIAINDFQPLDYFQQTKHKPDRFERLRIEPKKYRSPSGWPILFDGASDKFCRWKDLGDQYEWGKRVVARLQKYSSRPIIYRPRPGHRVPPRIPGCQYSTDALEGDLVRCGLVVSYGGNIGFDAVCAGKPHFALGDSIARPISEIDMGYVDDVFTPKAEVRLQWLYDVAYCQWTVAELQSGEAWAHIRPLLWP